MKLSRLLLCIIIIMVFLCTGCYDIRELESIAIVTGIAVDSTQHPNMIKFSVQIAKAEAIAGKGGGEKGGGSRQNSPVMMMDATAYDLEDALHSLRHDNSRELFLHHNQVVIFGKALAKQGIGSYLDALLRGHESRLEVPFVVADGDAKEILETELELEKISAVGIQRMIRHKAEISKLFGTNMLLFAAKMMENTASSVAPIIKVMDEEKTKRLSLTGLAVFKDDKMVGELNEPQSRGFAWLMGKIKASTITIDTKKGKAELEIISSSSKIKPNFNDGQKLDIKAEIEGFFDITELRGYENIEMEELLDLLVRMTKQEIQKLIMSCFKTCQNLNTDIFSFGEYIRRHHPNQWEKLRPRWDDIFPAINLSLEIDVTIEDTGKISLPPNLKGEKA